IRTGCGDGDLDRQEPLAAEPPHDVTDQRRLAVAARRDEEHLLARRQILGQPVSLAIAIRERGGRDDLAVDERVHAAHYLSIRDDYLHWRNRRLLGRPGTGSPRQLLR